MRRWTHCLCFSATWSRLSPDTCCVARKTRGTWNRNSSRSYFFSWSGFPKTFDSAVAAFLGRDYCKSESAHTRIGGLLWLSSRFWFDPRYVYFGFRLRVYSARRSSMNQSCFQHVFLVASQRSRVHDFCFQFYWFRHWHSASALDLVVFPETMMGERVHKPARESVNQRSRLVLSQYSHLPVIHPGEQVVIKHSRMLPDWKLYYFRF